MLRLRHYGLTAAFALLLGFNPVYAADDAYVIWRKAFDFHVQAEQARNCGNIAEAIRLYDAERTAYMAVKQAMPGGNQELIDSRIAACDEVLARLRTPMVPIAPATTATDTTGATTAPVIAAVASAAEAELAATKEKLFKALIELDDLRREMRSSKVNSQEIENLLREKRLLQEKYGMLEQQYQTLLNKQSSPDSEKELLKNQLLEAQVNYDLLLQKGQLIEKKFNESNEEIAKLYQERNQIRMDLKNATDKVAQLDREVVRLSTLQQSGEESGSQLQSRITILTAERDDARSQFTAKQKEYEQLLTRLANNVANDQTALLLANDNQVLQQKYDELQRDYNTLNSDFRTAREQQRELQLKLTRQGDTLQRIDDLRAQLERSNKELEARQEQQNLALELSRGTEKQALERARVVEGALKELQLNAAALEERLKSRENADLQNTESRNAELQELRNRLAEAQSQAAALSASGDDARSKLTAAEKRIAELRQEFIAVKAANASLEVDVRQLADLRGRCDELENTVAELQGRPDGAVEIARLEQELAAARQEIAVLQAASASVAAVVPTAPVVAPVLPPTTTTAGTGTVRGAVRILSADEVTAALKAADEAMANDTPDLAVWEYKRILRSQPDQLEANRALGRICLAEQRFFDAESYLKKALEQTPEDVALRVDWAMALNGAGESQEALKNLLPLLEQNPGLVNAHLAAGRANFNLNRLAEAETAFRRALELEPDHTETLLELSRLLLVLDRKEEAVAAYERARMAGARPDSAIENALGVKLAVNRELCDFLTKAAQEAIGARDWDSAAWYYGQLTGLEPRRNEWHVRLAFVQLQRGDATAALAAIAAARSADAAPGAEAEAQRLALSATAYLIGRQPAEAVKCFGELGAIENAAAKLSQGPFAALPALIQEALARAAQSPELSQAEVKLAREAWEKIAGTGK